ncbi:transposase InsO family protein [Kribbella italica]|uniref:Transposase InsO family protein n=1 Tax=Kribbella italica TaxID=1540520 RepID=A0A7W9MW15_9ACTN|nr:transposase InsO family protein [Kribbella italica]
MAWYADHGITTERVLSDNGSAYRSRTWHDTCTSLGITPKKTRPYRPQTNGKVERFHRTLADGWAYARFYASNQERNSALAPWLHFYNHCESPGGWSGIGHVRVGVGRSGSGRDSYNH